MNTGGTIHSPTTRLLGAVGLPLVLLLGVSACSSSNNNAGDTHASNVAPNAKQAAMALNAGLKAHAAGNLNAAAADYNKTLKYDATNKYAFYNLALIDAAHGNYGLAEAKYRSAIKTDPAYEPALFNLAILRTARNDPKEAISLYQRAVAADKKDAAAWLNLGLLLRADGHKHDGDKDVLKAIGLDSSLTDPANPAKASGPGNN
jgi:tetratricopeptide (TPR) repeat protein